MRIFNLQSKIHLVGWSIVLGLGATYVSLFLTAIKPQHLDSYIPGAFGWPYKVVYYSYMTDLGSFFRLAILINSFFWIWAAYIVLSLINDYRKILNLESKTNLLMWSVVVGISASMYILYVVSLSPDFFGTLTCQSPLTVLPYYVYRFPFNLGTFYGSIFWTLVSLIVLSLIRNFRNNIKNSGLLKMGCGLVLIILGVIVFGFVTSKNYSCKVSKELNNSNNDAAIRKNNPIPRLPNTDSPIPKGASTPTSDRIITHNGQKLVKDQIVVILMPGTLEPDLRIKQIADETNATITGSVSETLTYELQFNIQSYEELSALKMKLKVMKDVQSANRSFLPVLSD